MAASRSVSSVSRLCCATASCTRSSAPSPAPPEWNAPDGTAVSGGTLLTKSANGAGNIPELLFDANQIGGTTGIFEDTTQILRLNTVGGVAPAGSCDPETQAIATVPYQADYPFLG